MTCLQHAGAFSHDRIETEGGNGEVISCTVFPGIQAVYNDLHLPHCGRCVPGTEDVVEINYCLEGRYECEVSSQYCFYASPGDLSVGSVGRREAAGSFPTGRFSGLTLFIELIPATEQNESILREMEISLDVIRQMAIQEPRRFYLRGEAEIDDVCRRMISASSDHCLPSLKLKTLELLMLISDPGLLRNSRVPVYLSQKNVRLARDVRQRITEDLSFHLTLRQLSEELHASPTTIKNAFRSVYHHAVEACNKGGYNAATYEMVMPDIDSELWLAIWKDGHVDSGSPKGICACLAR